AVGPPRRSPPGPAGPDPPCAVVGVGAVARPLAVRRGGGAGVEGAGPAAPLRPPRRRRGPPAPRLRAAGGVERRGRLAGVARLVRAGALDGEAGPGAHGHVGADTPAARRLHLARGPGGRGRRAAAAQRT